MAVDEPSDGMAEEVERQLQLAISAAALAARKLIGGRQVALAVAAARGEADAQQLRAQLERERALASSQIQPVFDDVWWDAAQPRDVGEVWELAEQWRDPDALDGEATVFDRAAERIQQETQDRWCVDAGAVAALAYVDNVVEYDRLATAAVEQTAEDRVDAGAPAAGERYDSRERRDRLQARLASAGVPQEAVNAEVLTDTAQAHPAAEAAQPEREQVRAPARSGARTAARERHRTR